MQRAFLHKSALPRWRTKLFPTSKIIMTSFASLSSRSSVYSLRCVSSFFDEVQPSLPLKQTSADTMTWGANNVVSSSSSRRLVSTSDCCYRLLMAKVKWNVGSWMAWWMTHTVHKTGLLHTRGDTLAQRYKLTMNLKNGYLVAYSYICNAIRCIGVQPVPRISK